jgi:D-glycero-alpha-D-manno-heptose-7-phosphate kinase
MERTAGPLPQVVRSRTPVRLDLAGGTLDIWPLYLTLPPPARTVNVALDLPARVTVEATPPGDARVRIVSRDREAETTFADLADLRRQLARGVGPLRLLARAVDALGPERGLTLTTEAQSPVGAGLGGSSSLVIAVLGALSRFVGRTDEPHALRALAQDLEAWLLRTPTGYQDYYPPLLGGCLSIEGRPGGLQVTRLPVDLARLAARLRLVYTGAPHDSGLTNWGTLRAYLDGEEPTVRALHAIADCARDVHDALTAGDLDLALRAVVDEGSVRLRLAPGVSTPAIEALDRDARAAGAWGTKICGAGGGGCVLVVLPPEPLGPALDQALAQPGFREIPVRLDAEGLRVDASAR